MATRVERITKHLNHGTGRLTGKVALITGAGSGIGRATAIMFVQQGAMVMVTDLSQDAVDETCNLANEQGPGKAIGRVCDVTNAQQVEAVFKDCVNELKKLDIVFANAGALTVPTMFTEYTKDDFDFVMNVNVWGVLNCFREAVKILMANESGGSLIATSSVAGIRSGAGDTIYSASKAAVISICQTVANQLNGTGIRCNAICPGLIETGMTAGVFQFADEKGVRDQIGRINPMMRYGAPSEIASAALFLASDDSSYVTGQAYAVCGGLSSSHPVTSRRKGKVSF